MFSKQFITIPHSNNLSFGVRIHAFNKFIFTFLCENRKRYLILSDVVAEITELWEAELLDLLILINVVPQISHGGAKFDPLLCEFSMNMNICQIDILD